MTDEFDNIVAEILMKADLDPEFPLLHALSTALRWQVLEASNRGERRERKALAKLVANHAKSSKFFLKHDMAEICDIIIKEIQKRK